MNNINVNSITSCKYKVNETKLIKNDSQKEINTTFLKIENQTKKLNSTVQSPEQFKKKQSSIFYEKENKLLSKKINFPENILNISNPGEIILDNFFKLDELKQKEKIKDSNYFEKLTQAIRNADQELPQNQQGDNLFLLLIRSSFAEVRELANECIAAGVRRPKHDIYGQLYFSCSIGDEKSLASLIENHHDKLDKWTAAFKQANDCKNYDCALLLVQKMQQCDKKNILKFVNHFFNKVNIKKIINFLEIYSEFFFEDYSAYENPFIEKLFKIIKIKLKIKKNDSEDFILWLYEKLHNDLSDRLNNKFNEKLNQDLKKELNDPLNYENENFNLNPKEEAQNNLKNTLTTLLNNKIKKNLLFLQNLAVDNFNYPNFLKLIDCIQRNLDLHKEECEHLILHLYAELHNELNEEYKESQNKEKVELIQKMEYLLKWSAQNLCDQNFSESNKQKLLERLFANPCSPGIILKSGELFFVKIDKMHSENKIDLEKNYKNRILFFSKNKTYVSLSQYLQEFVAEKNMASSLKILHMIMDCQTNYEEDQLWIPFRDFLEKNFQVFESKINELKVYKVFEEIKAGKGITDCPSHLYDSFLNTFIKNHEWDLIPNLQTLNEKTDETQDKFNFHNCLPSITLQIAKGAVTVDVRNLLNTPRVAVRLGLTKNEIENAAKENKLEELLQTQVDLEKKIDEEYEKIIRVYKTAENMKQVTHIGPNTLLKAIRMAIHHFYNTKNTGSTPPFIFENKHLFCATNNKKFKLILLRAKNTDFYGSGGYGIVHKAHILHENKPLAFKISRNYLKEEDTEIQLNRNEKSSVIKKNQINLTELIKKQHKAQKMIKKGHDMLNHLHELHSKENKLIASEKQTLKGFPERPILFVKLKKSTEPNLIGILGKVYLGNWHTDSKKFPLSKKIKTIGDLFAAVAFLDRHGIAHMDIKPGNMLYTIDKKGELASVLSDLDGATNLDDKRHEALGIHTKHYVSGPLYEEIKKFWNDNNHKACNDRLKKTDVYSSGLTALEFMLNKKHGFNKNVNGYVDSIYENDFNQEILPEAKIPNKFVLLLKNILTSQPTDIMSAQEAFDLCGAN